MALSIMTCATEEDGDTLMIGGVHTVHLLCIWWVSECVSEQGVSR